MTTPSSDVMEAVTETVQPDRQAIKAEFDQAFYGFWDKTWPILIERFPAVFPREREAARPLSLTIAADLMAAMGWSQNFTKATLRAWKLSPQYCHGVLRHTERIDLQGNPVAGETVDDEARRMATQRLAAIKQRRQKKRDEEFAQVLARRAAQRAAKASAEQSEVRPEAEPVTAQPTPVETPTPKAPPPVAPKTKPLAVAKTKSKPAEVKPAAKVEPPKPVAAAEPMVTDTAPKRKTLSLKAPPPTLPTVSANVVVREIEPRRAKAGRR